MSLGSLGTASVGVTADMTGYDAAVARMPEKIAQAQQKIRAEMTRNSLAIKTLMATGAGTYATYAPLIQQQEILAKKLNAVEFAAGKAAGALANASGAGSRAGGGRGGPGNAASEAKRQGAYRLMQVGQTLDDLQYVGEQGIRPILNNLMQISPILGIVGIALDQVAKHWSFFTGGAEKAKTAVETLAARVKELEDKKVKFAWDLTELDMAKRKLDELKEREETIARLRKGRTEAAGELGQSVEKSVAESGGLDNVVGALTAKAMEQMVKDGTAKGKTAKEFQGLEEATRQGFLDEIVKATKGDAKARGRLIFAGNNAGRGAGGEFAANLSQNDPAAAARQKEVDSHREYLKQQADDEATAAEENDQVNLQAWEASKARRERRAKQAADEAGAGLRLDLMRRNALVSDTGRSASAEELGRKLEATGVDPEKAARLAKDTVDLVVREMEAEVKTRQLRGGAGGAVGARSAVRRELEGQVRDERKAQIQKEFGKAEMLSTDSYLSKLTLAGQSATNDPAVQAVEQQKKTNEKLDVLIKKQTPEGRLAWSRYGKFKKG